MAPGKEYIKNIKNSLPSAGVRALGKEYTKKIFAECRSQGTQQ
jgi:hypothetical protein